MSPLVLLASICCGQLCIKYGMYVFIHFKDIICVETDIVFDNTKYKIWGKILDWQLNLTEDEHFDKFARNSITHCTLATTTPRCYIH